MKVVEGANSSHNKTEEKMNISNLKSIAVISAVMCTFAIAPAASAKYRIISGQDTGKGGDLPCKPNTNGTVSIQSSDGTWSQYSDTQYECLKPYADGAPPVVGEQDADLSDLAPSGNTHGGNISFDEALATCRQIRGVNLQTCIDEKTGQRRGVAKTPVNHNTVRKNKLR